MSVRRGDDFALLRNALVAAALLESGGSKKAAARRLGVSRSAVQYVVRKLE
jgi:predicted transcriptional regulator